MNVSNSTNNEPDTIIEEIAIVYESALAIGSDLTYGVEIKIPSEFSIPDESEYAIATTVGRERAKRAYPTPRRAKPTPTGEEIDVL